MTRLTVPVELRWNDLDAYGHVNNAAMLVLLEEARISAFWRTDPAGNETDGDEAIGATTAVLDGRPGSGTLTLVARQEIEYLAPVPYSRHPLEVELWLGHLGGASLTVDYEVHGTGEGRPLHARAETTIVLVDAATQQPRRITPEERDAWTPYLDAPIAFRRR